MGYADSFKCCRTLNVNGRDYIYYSLRAAEENGLQGVSLLPLAIKILLENLLRFEDGRAVTKRDIEHIAAWAQNKGRSGAEITYRPARVLMQDFTGVPAVVDLAAMRDAMKNLGGDAEKINPLIPVDLVIDHSVAVDEFGTPLAFEHNVEKEYQRNGERYRFLKWGKRAFRNFRAVPPGTGICHQVNLEYLAQVVCDKEYGGEAIAYPDTCIGADSHTTMVNGLGVLGWGVGGIEAEAAMLGQPISMLLPEVIGFRLTGALKEGVTATDLVLTITQMLRKKGVVGKFVEFFGEGLEHLSLADRATISNMAPEYGATCGFFPIDKETIHYLKMTGRAPERIALVEAYARAQGLWRDDTQAEEPIFTEIMELDIGETVTSMAGPKRPEGRLKLSNVSHNFAAALEGEFAKKGEENKSFPVDGESYGLKHGDVVIAAITSCTNTSNPGVLIAAGLLARNAVEKGLNTKPWVKTSLAPGSQVVEAYLQKAGLQKYLDALGFDLAGFGCTTCIGNSGPLPAPISRAINNNGIIAAAVLSGNRNFEGRVSPDTQANYLASPPLAVAHALAGTVAIDMETEPLGEGKDGKPIYLRDIWPSSSEIKDFIEKNVTRALFEEKYADVFKGDAHWQAVSVPAEQTYAWDENSTYVRRPPYFDALSRHPQPLRDIEDARILGLFSDKITTDHISPAGAIKADSPAGEYLLTHGVKPADFNQYGARRGNHEVMMRGTFANIRIRNLMAGLSGRPGGRSVYYPGGEVMPIYDAAIKYQRAGVPLVVFAGAEYGNGSSRDWAAKGPRLLGVRAVIAQSFERIHRSNLVGMGIAPFTFENGVTWQSLGLKGDETVTIKGMSVLRPRQKLELEIRFVDGRTARAPILCRVDTPAELEYLRNGGILPFVLRRLATE